MKQKKWTICLLLALLALTLCLAVACNQKTPNTPPVTEDTANEHSHSYSDKWSYDEEGHYHAATCGHDKEQDRTKHTYGNWKIVTSASCYATGIKERSCTICEYKQQDEIEKTDHIYSNTWSHDEQGHYHAATCGHQLETDKEPHKFNGSTCSICDYTVDYTPGMTYRQVNFGTGLSYELIGIGTASGGTIIVPDTYNGLPVISIASSAFANCIAIKEIVIPNSVINIPNGAFAGCTSLEKLSVPFVNGMVGAMFGSATYTCTDYNQLLPVKTKEFSWKVSGQTFMGARPVDGTDWTLNETWVTVNGKQMLYQEEAVNASTWTTYNLYISGVKVDSWEIPSRATCNVYAVPKTLALLTITNQLISPFDAAFANLPCMVDILQKYEIQSLEMVGPAAVYIDEFDYADLSLRVSRINGDVETHYLTSENFSASDNAKFQTLGKHTVTANFENKTISFQIEIKEHVFDDAVFESQSFYYDGKAKYLKVTGIPEGTDIKYSNNGQSAIGEHTVSVTLTKQYYTTLTLTAKLNILNSTFTITYVLGKVDATHDNPTQYNYYDETIVLKVAECPGHGFTGWYLEPQYRTKFTSIEQNSNENITLYAKWEAIFTVSNNTITGLTTYGKTNYVNITIPNSIDGMPITAIGESAFSGCSKLQAVTFTGDSQLTSFGSYAFNGCSSLTSISIPESVTSIGERAFSGCSKLQAVTFTGDSQLTSIGSYAFYNCSSLTSISIPESVTSIGSSAFVSCSKLQTITFEGNNQLTSIDDYAFYNCTSLTSIIIPESVTRIGDYAFGSCSSLTSITIPQNVTRIGERAFIDCIKLQTVTFEGNSQLSSIDRYAFYGCSSLTSITIPERVTSIGERAFGDCISLTTVYWNATNCTKAGSSSYAIFDSCTSLTTLKIGHNVQTIPDSAFSGCSSLQTVTFEGNSQLTSIPYSAFRDCRSLKTVTFEGNSQLTSIDVSAFYGCSSLTSITIPQSVTSIGSFAFDGCSSLTSITIPQSVTSIPNSAFRSCSSLTSITIPENVTSIGERAFSGCSKLQAVTFTGDCQLTSIGDYAFNGCSSLQTVTFERNSQLTSIDSYAFFDCSSLTSITIPESVTSIGDSAFGRCSILRIVYYGGTKEQWYKISIGNYNTTLMSATRYYYSEEEPQLNQTGNYYDGNYWHWVDGAPTIWKKEN